MAFIEAPGTLGRDPEAIGHIEGRVGSLNRTGEEGRVNYIGQQLVLHEELPRTPGFLLSKLRKADINPAGEEVFCVPGRLTVTEKNESVSHCSSLLTSSAHPGAAAEEALALRQRLAERASPGLQESQNYPLARLLPRPLKKTA